jgi:tetratricopeptide (TPR) repeat protein
VIHRPFAEQSAWSTIDEAVRRGYVPGTFVEYIRTTGEFSLVQLLEYVGQSALDRHDDRTAEQLYSSAAELGSVNAGVPYNLGNIAGRASRDREAIQHYDAAIKLDPGLALAYYNRGLARRRTGDEPGAQTDITMAIVKGYDGLAVYAALLRTRETELGAPVEALQQGVEVLQTLAAGEADFAAILAQAASGARRQTAGGHLSDRIALLVALDSEFDVARRLDDVQRAITLGEELVDLCDSLATLDPHSWGGREMPLHPYVVEKRPARYIALAEVYELAARHDAALSACAAAIAAAGASETPGRQLARASAAVAEAVYAEMRRRAERAGAG